MISFLLRLDFGIISWVVVLFQQHFQKKAKGGGKTGGMNVYGFLNVYTVLGCENIEFPKVSEFSTEVIRKLCTKGMATITF